MPGVYNLQNKFRKKRITGEMDERGKRKKEGNEIIPPK